MYLIDILRLLVNLSLCEVSFARGEIMIERMTIEIPAEYREAMRLERFEKRTTYREILKDMFEQRYGIETTPEPRNRKSATATPEGSPVGA